MKTAYAFDGYYFSCHDGFSCGGDSLSAFLFTAYDIDLRTAFVTAHRLCVITPCGRVGVFLLAVFAHWKVSHCGANSVIGHRVHNSEPWTALSTVYKRVEISSVCFVEKLRLAFFAHCNVRRNKNIPFFLFAVDYLKAVKWWLVQMGGNYLHYHRTLRRTALKGFFQLVHSLFTALCVYLNIRAFVCHSSAKPKVCRFTAHKGSKAHALNDAINTNYFSFHQISSLTVSFISSSASLLRTSISTSSNSSPS